jgi:hypothetical protein
MLKDYAVNRTEFHRVRDGVLHDSDLLGWFTASVVEVQIVMSLSNVCFESIIYVYLANNSNAIIEKKVILMVNKIRRLLYRRFGVMIKFPWVKKIFFIRTTLDVKCVPKESIIVYSHYHCLLY